MRKKDMKVFMFVFVILFVIAVVKNIIESLAAIPFILWVSIVCIIIGMIFLKKYVRHKNRQLIIKGKKSKLVNLEEPVLISQGNLNHLKQMHSREFEEYIRDLFIVLGFDAHLTPSTMDGGKDIFIYHEDFFALGGCKCYTTGKVSRPQIQIFHSAMIDCKADKGYFFTTSDYSSPAKSYVLDKPIILINGYKLLKIVDEVSRHKNPIRNEKALKLLNGGL